MIAWKENGFDIDTLISKGHLGHQAGIAGQRSNYTWLFICFVLFFFSAFVFGREEQKINLVVEKFNMVLDAVILLLLL